MHDGFCESQRALITLFGWVYLFGRLFCFKCRNIWFYHLFAVLELKEYLYDWKWAVRSCMRILPKWYAKILRTLAWFVRFILWLHHNWHLVVVLICTGYTWVWGVGDRSKKSLTLLMAYLNKYSDQKIIGSEKKKPRSQNCVGKKTLRKQ